MTISGGSQPHTVIWQNSTNTHEVTQASLSVQIFLADDTFW